MTKHTRLAEYLLTIWKNMGQELKKGIHYSILSSVPSFVIRQCKLSTNAKSLIYTNRLCFAISITSNIESIERLKGLHFNHWRSPYNSISIRRYLSFFSYYTENTWKWHQFGFYVDPLPYSFVFKNSSSLKVLFR